MFYQYDPVRIDISMQLIKQKPRAINPGLSIYIDRNSIIE